MIPVEVIILTDNDDIKGTVYVSSAVAANRQLTELLNDSNRRFWQLRMLKFMQRIQTNRQRDTSF